jgi:hypothetical protein
MALTDPAVLTKGPDDMSTLTFPSSRFPAPPSVSLEVPDTWEPVSVPAVAMATRQAEANADFTPNVIVRLGTRPELDQVADAVIELRGSVEGRPDAAISEPRPVQINGLEFHRLDASWDDPQFGRIHQVHAFVGLPRQDALQDFVHITGSAGGKGGEQDLAVVEQVIASARVTR